MLSCTLNHIPNISKTPILIVRQLQPTSKVINEIYVMKESNLKVYDYNIQSDINHLIAILPRIDRTTKHHRDETRKSQCQICIANLDG